MPLNTPTPYISPVAAMKKADSIDPAAVAKVLGGHGIPDIFRDRAASAESRSTASSAK